MRGSKSFGPLSTCTLLLALLTGCRDKDPGAPPPPGPQENFAMDGPAMMKRTLKGTLPAPADEIARTANALFKRMGLNNVTSHVRPNWSAVVHGQKDDFKRSPYELRVRPNGDGSYDAYIEIEVGLTGDEDVSRYIVGELCRDLNIAGSAPAAVDPGPPSGN
jgi:hypothetical protein